MKFLVVLCSLFVLSVVATECNLDAELETEWQVSFDGSSFANGQTTFCYTIDTVIDDTDSRCSSDTGNCQDLSHWVIMVPCGDCYSTTPASSCGPDGQITLNNESVIGVKWEVEESSTSQQLSYCISYDGFIGETTISYIVKGSTRCGSGDITGPDFNGECAPGCVSNSDCIEGGECSDATCFAGVCSYVDNVNLCAEGGECADATCSAGVCSYADNADNCNDGGECSDNVCSNRVCSYPDNVNLCVEGGECADATCSAGVCSYADNADNCNDGGECSDNVCSNRVCSYPDNHDKCEDNIGCTDNICFGGACSYLPDHEFCNDGLACTENTCDTQLDCVITYHHDVCEDPFFCTEDICVGLEGDVNGCQNNEIDSRCDDGASCSDEVCLPQSANADVNGCVYNHFDDRCGDNIDCTDDECVPSNSARTDGCTFTENDANCEDSNVCTDDYCRIDDFGCIFENNSSPCDDGDECTGTAIDFDQCAGGSCQSGGLVCPPSVSEIHAGQHYYAGTVTVTNDADQLYVIWDADSEWISKEFHIYIGTDEPAKSNPGRFPYKFTLAQSVSSAEFIIPFPDDVACDTPVFFAFHLVVDPNGNVICTEDNRDCTSQEETAWMDGNEAPDGWHQWGNYGSFETCCCAGFSHLDDFIGTSATEVVFVESTRGGRGKSTSSDRLEFAVIIAEILEVPVSTIIIFELDYDEDGSLGHAIIGFTDASGIAPQTLTQVLMNTPESEFEEFGIEQVEIVPIEDASFDGLNSYSSFSDFSVSSTSDDSASSQLVPSLMLFLGFLIMFF